MADVSGITAGNPQPQTYMSSNPLTTLSTLQDLQNKRTQNRLTEQQLVNAGTQNQQQVTELTKTQQSMIGGWSYALALDPNLTPALAMRHLDEAKNLGVDGSKIDAIKGWIKPDMTPQELQNGFRRLSYATMPADVQQRMAKPDNVTIDSGQVTTLYNVPRPGEPGANIPVPALSTQNLPRPEWQPNYDPNSRQTIQTPSPPVGRGGIAAPPIPGSGRYPAPGATPGGAGAGVSPGGVTPPVQTAKRPPGNAPAPIGTQQSVEANQTAFVNDQRDIPDAENRVRDLQIAHTALGLVMTSGRGSEAIQKIQSFLTTVGVAPDVIVEKTKNYDEAKKYLLNYAKSLPGVKSNEGMAAAIDANASTGISNTAALDVTRTNIARERFKMAQVMTHPDKTGNGYLQKAADFAQKYDRRAFSADMLPDAQLNKLLAGMTKNERIKFEESIELADRLGFYNPQAASKPMPKPTKGQGPLS